VWLDRGVGLRSGGVTANHEEVASCVQQYGFAIADPATLSVREQLALVRAATVIGGPHGAQFVLAQFMPASSTVIECFSPIYVNPSILEICRVLRHSYHQIVARSHLLRPYALGRDCEVDCEHLRLVLDSLPAEKN
jgi:capsular polysaccharide biosynthesis protein